MAETRLEIAKKDIVGTFESDPRRVFRRRDIEQILAQERGFWRLAQSTTFSAFVDFLAQKTPLHEVRFDLPYKPTLRYVWGDAPLFEIVQSLRPEGYFCHYTAVFLHGFTNQIPKRIYLNDEQQNRGGGGELTQVGIDRAFRGKCRTSNNIASFRDYSICVVNGQNTNCLGVENVEAMDGSHVRVTTVERTLIDIAVRPIYSGGVHEVLNAYASARDHVSVNRLGAMLKRLNFTYPYHQAIGFYLERAGCSPEQLDLLKRFELNFDFYLAHSMGETEYVEQWRLFVPKGL